MVVFTFRRANANPPARGGRLIGAAFAVSVFTMFVGMASATAQQLITGGCIGTGALLNCTARIGPAGDPFVRTVPPLDAAAAARAQERERRWVGRCRPVAEPDRYGVARYRYAAPGCEFGVGEN